MGNDRQIPKTVARFGDVHANRDLSLIVGLALMEALALYALVVAFSLGAKV